MGGHHGGHQPDATESRSEEAQRFLLLKGALESLGADPTAQTPDADVIGVASRGVLKVMADPRTTVGQCLDALLTAELTDHAGWELLIEARRRDGHGPWAARYTRCPVCQVA